MPGLKPFMPDRPSGPLFIGLNILRLLSIVSLILVFASNIVTVTDDVKAIKQQSSHSTNATLAAVDCDYYEYSTVPDQTGGAFWSVLNRVFILLECILLTLSEVGFPRVLFEEYIPVLGPAHGLGSLGVFQALIGAQVLSHYCELFPQVASWLLFIVGCLSILAGIFLRTKSKQKRLIFSWENVSSLTPQTRMAATAWDMATEKRSVSGHPSSGGSTAEHEPSRSAGHSALGRSASQTSDSPLLPQAKVEPGSRFGGFGFGRQGEKAAAERGWKISKPIESLPRYAT